MQRKVSSSGMFLPMQGRNCAVLMCINGNVAFMVDAGHQLMINIPVGALRMSKDRKPFTEKLLSGDDVPQRRTVGHRRDIPDDLRKYLSALGPTPRETLEAFVDLSLSDAEIAKYFQVPHHHIRKLRRIWNIYS